MVVKEQLDFAVPSGVGTQYLCQSVLHEPVPWQALLLVSDVRSPRHLHPKQPSFVCVEDLLRQEPLLVDKLLEFGDILYLMAYKTHLFLKILAQKIALRLICEVETFPRLIFSLTLTNFSYDQYFYLP